MTANLGPKKIKLSFKALLTVDDTDNGITAVLKAVCDGEGTPSPLFISTEEIRISQGFFLEGKSVTLAGAVDNFVWAYNQSLDRMELMDPGSISIVGITIGGLTF